MNADAASGHEGTFLVVVYDRYEDARRFVPLEGALQQIEDLAGELRPFGYRPMVLANPDQDELAVGLGRWAKEWRGGGQHGPAVVAWSGHAEVTAEGDLQLITRGTQNLDDDEDYFTAERLTNRALSGRADQILILLDTCHAGAGAPGALKKALTSMAQRTLPEPRRAWLGVLAACRAHEHAEGARGLLVETVLQVLRHGPTRDGALPGGRYRHEWSVRNKGISGETLALAVMEDWPESGQIPVRASAGTPEPMFRNPLWRPNAREALVEHLVLAARGIDPTEEGWFFTGRHRILREITDWLAEGRAGLLLLTGKAGSGKSAVVGRIAALSHPEERRAILMHAPLSKDDPDPGENSVDAALHLRGMRLQDMAEALAAKLGLPAPETPAGLIAALEGLEARGARRHVLVLDGLDEAASEQAGLIADQLLVPLSRLCTVLLASRDRPFQPHHEPGETLNAALTRTVGSTVRVLDLDEEEDTAGDIAVYVRSRLVADGVSRATADNIAPVLALRATGGDGGFLFARVVASSLARNLAADPDRPWREQIPEGITDAFDRDLASGAALHRDGRLLPHAADDLLTALAWGAGNGMPAHGVWETVAKAVSHDGTVYGPEDIDWVLMNYGRYIVEDSDGHQAVYRLYHRELIGHLQRRGASDVTEGRTPAPWTVIHELAALVLRQTGNGTHPQEANPYLRRHLADHALPATNVGIAVLRQLVEANAQAYMHVLASALNDLSVLCKEAELPFDAVGLAAEAVGIHRGLAESDPAAHLADLADSLNNLATHLGEAGRRLEAVEPAREAVDLRRRLAQDNPEAHLADLAVSLNNLSSLLSDVGRRDEALAAVEEATSLHRGLALDSPATRLPYLAASLSNLASQLSEAGRWEEGAQAMEEAASLFDEFTHPDPGVHLAHRAASLLNLAAHRAEIGQVTEAVVPAQQAVSLYRDLSQDSPSTHRPKLAMALSNLSNRLRAVGRRQEAVEPAQEAVRIRRELARDNPEAHTPGLANSLNSLSLRLAAVGRRTEAVEPAREAVRIRRELTGDNPETHTRGLANSLNNLALRLGEVGRYKEAVSLSQEALGIRRELARQNPTAHTRDLAGSLETLALQLSKVGRHGEAVKAAQEALGIRRRLVRDNPAIHTPDLADSLNTLALRLGAVEQWDRALELAQEAATLYRDLAHEYPAAHTPDLAMVLNNVAMALAEAGRPEEALEPAWEAVRLRRELARETPAAYLPNLALALSNLAKHLAAVGRREEAVPPAEEAVRLYRDLCRTNPEGFLSGLAMALNNIGVHLARVGRREEALTAAREAVDIRRELARDNPMAHLSEFGESLDNLARRLTEGGQEEAAEQSYREAVETFGDRPLVAAQFSCRLAEFLLSVDAHEAAVHTLCPLTAHPPADTDVGAHIALRARGLLRQVVRANPEQRATVLRLCGDGDQARRWLDVTEAALELTSSWLDTPTWEDSRAFLHAHPDLLGVDALPALGEWTLIDTTADLHRDLLRRIAAGTPIDVAYRPLVVREALAQWFRSSAGGTDWANSAAHLTAHADNLLAPDAALHLAAANSSEPDTERLVRIHRAILALAVRYGVASAYGPVTDPQALSTALREAVSAADHETLGLLAVIEELVSEAPWASAVHRLASWALTDEPVSAEEPTPEPVLTAAARQRKPTAEERRRAASEIATLIAARPDRAVELSLVLRAAMGDHARSATQPGEC